MPEHAMLKKPAVGFIGFGEAGSNIAKLRASELDRTLAFDIKTDDGPGSYWDVLEAISNT